MRTTRLTLAPWLAAAIGCGLACDGGPPPTSRDAAESGAGAAAAGGPGEEGSQSPPGIVARPEAVSLLGEPLYPLPLDSATEARRRAQLDFAEAAYAARPEDPEAAIWLGRRLAYMGRYREAIAVFTEAILRHGEDARLYRHRGHRFITVRELGRALDDLGHAARLVSGQEDVVEADGLPNAEGVPRTTLQTNIWYHLGLARYINHDFDGAAHAFREGLRIAPNDDVRVAMSDWLWLSLSRLGRDEEAAAVLEAIGPEMEILENEAYHRRLRLYKGELELDELIPAAADGAEPDPVDLATYGYALAALDIIRGDRVRAAAAIDRVLATGYWPAFGYIAAEADRVTLRPPPAAPDPLGTGRVPPSPPR